MLRRSRKVSKEVDTKSLVFSAPPTSIAGRWPPNLPPGKDVDENSLPATKTGGTTSPQLRSTAPTNDVRPSLVTDPWLTHDEANEINKLIAATAALGSNSFKERRKTKSSELPEDIESNLPAPDAEAPAVSQAPISKRCSSPKQISSRRKDSSGKLLRQVLAPRSPKAEANSPKSPKSPKTSHKLANATLETALTAVGLNVNEPTGKASVTKRRISHEDSTQNLSGAAARGAKAAAVGQLKRECVAAGGRFLVDDEWKAMCFETSQLRAQNKRLDATVSELREQISKMQNGSKHGRMRWQGDSGACAFASVSSVMSQIGSFIKTPERSGRKGSTPAMYRGPPIAAAPVAPVSSVSSRSSVMSQIGSFIGSPERSGRRVTVTTRSASTSEMCRSHGTSESAYEGTVVAATAVECA